MGDFWLWAAVDSDTKLVVSHVVQRRDWWSGEQFVEDLASRIVGPVQITTDNARLYMERIRVFFERHEGMSYATEKKHFEDVFDPKDYAQKRKNGVPKICKAERKVRIGNPDLSNATTSHIERVFLTVRQENARFGRLTLAYSKKLSMHRYAVALQFGIYNLCRRHKSLEGQTPAQAAKLEKNRWTIEDVVALTERFMRAREDAKFERAFERRSEFP